MLSSFACPHSTDTVLLYFEKYKLDRKSELLYTVKSGWLLTPPNTFSSWVLILNYFSGDCMFFWSLLIHQPLSWCGKQFWVQTSWEWVNNCNISGWTFPSRLMCLSCSFIYIDLNRDHRVGAADYTGILFWSASLGGSLAVFGSEPRFFLKDEEMP